MKTTKHTADSVVLRLILTISLITLGAVFGMSGAAQAQTKDKIEFEVGYLPIMPMSQLFVMEGEGWLNDAGIVFKKTKFSSGPAIVQAIASGKMDIMYFGIGPAMVARAKGVDLKVVASNVVEQVGAIAVGSLSELSKKSKSAAEAFRTFAQQKGRPAKLATLPKGSVPDTVLRHWLLKVLGLKADEVQIVGMGAGRVQQQRRVRA